MRLGEGRWLHSWSEQAASVVEPIVTAVSRLSKKKIGALIAIERTSSLTDVVASGVRLEAIVSPELIETVFWPAVLCTIWAWWFARDGC